ncbi:helix-turn-helix domain-containing protein [Streptomyces sp. NBC_00555]|uniref:helix-turn-helix domain-containing protein n=1 Tax=Streptomyces sp. NBC_00555 TaxID=2903662 RepID=UPI002256D8A4|nr:helix-turn-helix transcriptional regulator [Streptomyces sp. NBC_00555]MCX5012556.1 helix-turn-helix domain-containing protein [Streptomyces sp. NBC_00555]
MSEDTADAGFARLLRELKDRSGLSYGTLAKRLHMSTSTLHRYCIGDVVPADYAPVERLARLCKASPGELVELHRAWVLADANRPRKGGEPAVATLPAEPLPAEPAAASRPSGPSGPFDPPAPKGSRRIRRSVLAGIAVAAVAGAVALTAYLPTREADVRDSPAGAVSQADGEGQRTDGRTAAPEVAPSEVSPSEATPPSDSAPAAGAAPTTGPSASGRGEDTASGTPVKVTTQPYTWESPCSQNYLIEKPPAQVAPPPLERDAPAWVAAAGAVSAGEQYVTLTLQGSGKDTVVLDSLTVRTAGKRAPLAWNDYAMGYPGVGCGAGVPTRSFTVALDAARPAVVPEAGQPNFPFKVSESEPEVFYVKADASAYDVNWYLELSWSSGSRHGTVKIDNNGKPFRTSGHNGRPGYEFPLGGDGWVPAGTTS